MCSTERSRLHKIQICILRSCVKFWYNLFLSLCFCGGGGGWVMQPSVSQPPRLAGLLIHTTRWPCDPRLFTFFPPSRPRNFVLNTYSPIKIFSAHFSFHLQSTMISLSIWRVSCGWCISNKDRTCIKVSPVSVTPLLYTCTSWFTLGNQRVQYAGRDCECSCVR